MKTTTKELSHADIIHSLGLLTAEDIEGRR